jgi:hypothetical protein
VDSRTLALLSPPYLMASPCRPVVTAARVYAQIPIE